MNEHERETERAALWAEIARDNPEMDVDEALRVAGAELEGLLAFAADYDRSAEAQRLASYTAVQTA